MITIFTIPKPFTDPHTAVIQRNAIRSWLRLPCEVILLGHDEGVRDVAERLGVRHVSDVKYSAEGAPVLSSVFSVGNATATYHVRAYVNADVILLDDFVRAAESISLGCFLMVGRRWDVNIKEAWDFDKRDVRDYALQHGVEHGSFGLDYFIHTPDPWQGTIPPRITLGRMFWDNWLLCQANNLGVDTVDASADIFAIHQNHDYGHQFRGGAEEWEKLADFRTNKAIIGQAKHDAGSTKWGLVGGELLLR